MINTFCTEEALTYLSHPLNSFPHALKTNKQTDKQKKTQNVPNVIDKQTKKKTQNVPNVSYLKHSTRSLKHNFGDTFDAN